MPAGAILSPLTVAALAGWLGLDWRAVYAVLGVLSLLGCLSALRLRDPGIGRFEAAAGGGLLRSRTLRRVFASFAAYGMLLVPAATFLSTNLKERWGLEADARGLFTACCSAAAILVLIMLGRRLDAVFRGDPRRLPYVIAAVLACSGAAIALGAVAPSLPLAMAGFFAGLVLTPLIVPMMTLIMVAVTPPAGRSYTASVFGIGLAVGGLAGAGLLSAAGQSWGTVAIAVPGLVAGVIIASTARTVLSDLIEERSVHV